jgi:hypothetical protein
LVRRAAAGLIAALVTASCVGPARTAEDFQLKAKSTAETTLSAVGTARLVTRLAADDRAFTNFLSVLVGDAEDEATSAQATFDSIQPPTESSDQLRSEVDDLVARAVDQISDVRIAVRRGDLDEAATHDGALRRVGRELERFIEANE